MHLFKPTITARERMTFALSLFIFNNSCPQPLFLSLPLSHPHSPAPPQQGQWPRPGRKNLKKKKANKFVKGLETEKNQKISISERATVGQCCLFDNSLLKRKKPRKKPISPPNNFFLFLNPDFLRVDEPSNNTCEGRPYPPLVHRPSRD